MKSLKGYDEDTLRAALKKAQKLSGRIANLLDEDMSDDMDYEFLTHWHLFTYLLLNTIDGFIVSKEYKVKLQIIDETLLLIKNNLEEREKLRKNAH